MLARRLQPVLLAAALALAAAGPAAASYGWPVRPFDRQHPIRGFFGDPRTVFDQPLFAGGLDGPGSFSFHNGIDISASNGTAVYAVVSGIVHVLDGAAVSVKTLDGRSFQYFHVVPTVIEGEKVTARQTVLGHVQAPYSHVHLSEVDGIQIQNPLQKGHLTPYVDHTRPHVDAIVISNPSGAAVGPLGVCGRIAVTAAASDRPPVAVTGKFNGLPVSPALVTWRLRRLAGGVVVPRAVAVDFRTTLPAPADFWSVYARGSYQNAPRFGMQQFGAMPGRFLYSLTSRFDTKQVRNGVYELTASASDERRNTASLTERFSIFNLRTPTGCPRPAVPPPPPPTTTTTTTTSTTTTTTTTP